MPTWTVRHSSKFVVAAREIHAEFTRQFDRAINAKSPSEARREVAKTSPQFEEFEWFMEAVVDLKDGKSDPEEEMTYCEKDSDGLPIYSLIRGRWRGLYRVDKLQSACDAISIDEMSYFVRLHQGLRHLIVRRIDR